MGSIHSPSTVSKIPSLSSSKSVTSGTPSESVSNWTTKFIVVESQLVGSAFSQIWYCIV